MIEKRRTINILAPIALLISGTAHGHLLYTGMPLASAERILMEHGGAERTVFEVVFEDMGHTAFPNWYGFPFGPTIAITKKYDQEGLELISKNIYNNVCSRRMGQQTGYRIHSFLYFFEEVTQYEVKNVQHTSEYGSNGTYCLQELIDRYLRDKCIHYFAASV